MTTLPPRVRQAIEIVAQIHGVSVDDILGRRRFVKISDARREAMRACRRLRWGVEGLPPSYLVIGKWFDRDHATVIHACAGMDDVAASDAA